MRRLRQMLGLGAADAAQAPRAPGSIGVLMVCMGNICRSPTAEGVLREKLRRAALHDRVRVDSAGTHGWHAGEPPDARAIRCALQRGYDLAALRARALQADDFLRYDHLLAMDEANLVHLIGLRPEGATARIGLLMDHARVHADVRAVPDPYYGATAGFERVLDLIEDACDGLVAELAVTLAPPAAEGRRIE